MAAFAFHDFHAMPSSALTMTFFLLSFLFRFLDGCREFRRLTPLPDVRACHLRRPVIWSSPLCPLLSSPVCAVRLHRLPCLPRRHNPLLSSSSKPSLSGPPSSSPLPGASAQPCLSPSSEPSLSSAPSSSWSPGASAPPSLLPSSKPAV